MSNFRASFLQIHHIKHFIFNKLSHNRLRKGFYKLHASAFCHMTTWTIVRPGKKDGDKTSSIQDHLKQGPACPYLPASSGEEKAVLFLLSFFCGKYTGLWKTFQQVGESLPLAPKPTAFTLPLLLRG